MLTICIWFWGNKYSEADVYRLVRGIKRYLKQPRRLIVLTERDRVPFYIDKSVERRHIKDPELLEYKGCFARLRMFDYGWQRSLNIEDRLVCMDLDTIITGELDPLFDRPETFVILQGANSMNPCPFNGSLLMLRPGHHGNLWDDFSIDAAQNMRYYEFPDDQGWYWQQMPQAAGWIVGSSSGIYAFKKPGWPHGTDLPSDARMVVFPGKRSPNQFQHLTWVKKYWVM